MHATHFDAVTYDGAAYHLDCLPSKVRKLWEANDEEVSPIFADSEWDGFPTCDVCREKIDYVNLTDLGRKLERPFSGEIWRLIGHDGGFDLPAWSFPGGYGLIYFNKDGEVLCYKCANEADWNDAEIVDYEIYWEGPEIYCANCNAVIESEYGDPEENK